MSLWLNRLVKGGVMRRGSRMAGVGPGEVMGDVSI